MDPTPDNMTVLLEHGGITAVFALGLLWMLQRVGMRLIAAIDQHRQESTRALERVGEKIDEHTVADTAVEARMSRLEGVIMGRESMTPVEGVPIVQSPPERSTPVGAYSIQRPFGGRPKTEPGGKR
jgi:hypothetical protein